MKQSEYETDLMDLVAKELMKQSEYETDLMDLVAKELFVRRVFNLRDTPDFEIQASAENCYNKALLFIEARRKVIEKISV